MAAPAAQTRSGVWLCRQPSRCVAAVQGGENGKHRFMVGTCAISERNEIHMVEFSEDSAEVSCRQSFIHEEEVWLLSPSPFDSRHILTCSPTGKASPALRLFRTSQEPEASLDMLASLDAEDQPLNAVKSALWDPHQEGNLVVADAEAVHVFQGGSGSSGGRLTRSLTLHVGQRCSGGCLDPHHRQQVSTVDDSHLKTWDLRTSRVSFKKDNAHLFGARDVDYNPNVPYQVLTSGEDSTLRFWDLRQLSSPLRQLNGGHHHWALRARYNGHHDQLVLSCGTDSMVCLWRAGSVASAPLGLDSSPGGAEDGVSAKDKRPPDGLIKRYEEHEDSCYSCCWSLSDAWVFASVSFDGKLVINRVPGEEKYRILL
eukprot:TRINITY_DN27683_c0_g1_i1.p1 TRINITY_DN27683_c0_g1~~TRINITY_DN27683_c0_g1_i1.p1  ORF type:complete len:385 (+),score=37.00 TRINITY_DN27683_c0_g1_i1:46-1155(+)